MMEGIALCEEISGNKMNYQYVDQNRIGDHIWYISDVGKFKSHYPQWDIKYDLKTTLVQIHDSMLQRV
jgi:CDP-paratose 2-epimerase